MHSCINHTLNINIHILQFSKLLFAGFLFIAPPCLWAEFFFVLIEFFLYSLLTDFVGRLLGPRVVCRMLGISYSTLLRWIREGKIRVVKTVGGRYRISYSEVGKFLGK